MLDQISYRTNSDGSVDRLVTTVTPVKDIEGEKKALAAQLSDFILGGSDASGDIDAAVANYKTALAGLAVVKDAGASTAVGS